MIKHDNLMLDHQLCFALYTATHAITRAYRHGLEKAGLTYTQYLVMLVLWEKDCISVSNIANRLELDSATLTPMLKRLEIAGFLKRIRNKADERIVDVQLTDAGNALQQDIALVQQNVECTTQLCNDEFVKLRESLKRLSETISKETKQI